MKGQGYVSWVSLGIASSLVLSCSPRKFNASQVNYLETSPLVPQGEEVSFQLRRVRELGIPHKAYLFRRDENAIPAEERGRPGAEGRRIERLVPRTTALSPRTNYHVKVVFPSLTQEQYEKLKAIYGGIATGWKANEPYELVDLLSPPMQALTGMHFIIQRENVKEQDFPWIFKADLNPRTRGEINVVANCWSAAWEAARKSSSEVSIFFVGDEAMRAQLENESYFTKVKTLTLEEVSSKTSETRNAGLLPGDIALIYQTMMIAGAEREVLAHVITYLDDDFYFEKSNPDSNFLYRNSFFNDIVTELATFGPAEPPAFNKLRVEFRRRTSTPLPKPSQVFGLDKEHGLLWMGDEHPQKPPLDVLQSFSVAPEYSVGGGTLGTPLYRIVDVPIAPTGPHGRYQAEGSWLGADPYWMVPGAAARGQIECPQGYRKKNLGTAGGVICTDGTSAWGPFTEAMIRKCIQWTGDETVCRTDRWSLNLAVDARGTGRCPDGARLDSETGYCVEGGNAFGPFPQALVAKCQAQNGGAACRSARWSQTFLKGLL